MKISAVLSSLAFATLALADGSFSNFTSCASGPAAFTVLSASLGPFPYCTGQQLCLTVTGPLSEPIIAGGKWNFITKLYVRNGWAAYNDHQSLDPVVVAGGNTLPIPASAPGTNSTIKFCTTVKANNAYSFPYLYHQFSATNGDGRTLFCQQGIPPAVPYGTCPPPPSPSS